MTVPPELLTELERDALTELVNIGVSRAASALRKMIGRQVILSVPSMEVLDHATAAALIGEREAEELVAVRQTFHGAFDGHALLIFPETNSRTLVHAVMGDEAEAAALPGMEDEALAETGNVVLNGCLATMANMLQRSLTMSLPEVVRGHGQTLFSGHTAQEDGIVLFLYINFSVREHDIRGYLAMMMDLPSLAALKDLIADFIARVIGDDPVHAG